MVFLWLVLVKGLSRKPWGSKQPKADSIGPKVYRHYRILGAVYSVEI